MLNNGGINYLLLKIAKILLKISLFVSQAKLISEIFSANIIPSSAPKL